MFGSFEGVRSQVLGSTGVYGVDVRKCGVIRSEVFGCIRSVWSLLLGSMRVYIVGCSGEWGKRICGVGCREVQNVQ